MKRILAALWLVLCYAGFNIFMYSKGGWELIGIMHIFLIAILLLAFSIAVAIDIVREGD